MTKKSTIFFMYGFLSIASLISIFPLVWMVIAATNRSVDVVAGKLTIGGNLFRNYLNLTSSQNVWKFFFNSAKYAVLTTVLSLFVCSLAGYAFEIYHDKWKDRLFTVILMTMMLPFVALMVPLFQMFSKARLLNSTLGFLLPSLSMMISSLTAGYTTDYGMLMLAVLITTLPTAVVFFVLQKNFAEGITGAIK